MSKNNTKGKGNATSGQSASNPPAGSAPGNSNQNAGTGTAVANPPANPPATVIPVPTPAPMATPMGGLVMNGGHLALDVLNAEEERIRAEIEKQKSDLAAAIKARREKTIAEVNSRFAALPGQFGLATMEEFETLFGQFRAGTIGQEVQTPATNGKRKQGQEVPAEVVAKIDTMLKAGIPNVRINTETGISLPWISERKGELGLKKSRKKK